MLLDIMSCFSQLTDAEFRATTIRMKQSATEFDFTITIRIFK